jgi:ABC-type multidrug transport system ATPase subunit
VTATTAQDAVLVAEGVSRTYPGPVVALADVDLALAPGRILGLIGPNGAGKTTFAQIAVGLLAPTAGKVHVLGREVRLGRREVQRAIAYMRQEPQLFADLTPPEALTLLGRLRGLGATAARRRAAELVERLGLGALGRRPIAALSGGERQRVALGAAALVPTPLVVLDEPTAALDADFRAAAWGLIRELADRGSAVLLVTHLLAEAQAVVDDVAVLVGGRVRVQGAVADVVRALDRHLRVRLPPGVAPPPASWARVGAGSDPSSQPRRELLVAPEDLPACLRWLAERSARGGLEALEIRPPSLEEVMAAWLDAPPRRDRPASH